MIKVIKKNRPKGLKYKIKVVNKSWIKRGQSLSPNTQFKKGLVPWSKGKHLIPWNKGTKGLAKPNSGSFKRNDIRNGKNHHSWKGGITSENEKIRKSSQYKEWRLQVFGRDNYTCRACGERGIYLEAHHIKPFAEYPELRFEVNNGLTLCRKCHDLRPKITLWYYENIYPTAKIGDGTSIGSFVEIGNNVKIGKKCKIEAFVFIPEGVELQDGVFVGPHACFTNDKKPPSKKWSKTLIESGASIGANATILPGITIGKGAMIGAGAVVTKNIPPNETWAGVPARKL
jgi:acetyltransferase-like isoleucine patch superfamily enzyme